MAPELRVGIVNDLKLATEVLRRTVQGMPGCTVAWTAADGEQALAACRTDTPDIILMDLVMPVMDGVEATRRIMAETPCAILVVTATVAGNLSMVYDAMGHGALDAVNMPVPDRSGRVAPSDPLPVKIRNLARLLDRPLGPEPPAPAATPAGRGALVALGCSTGGPRALGRILAALPGSFTACVVVVQHVDAAFAPGLRDWLAGLSRLPVRLVQAGTRPDPGQVLLAETNDHMVLRADGCLDYSVEPAGVHFRPSVDVFFNSVANHWTRGGVGVLLTGMGRDGAAGLLALKRAGFRTIAQDRDSSVVFGMPRAAIELGAAEHVLALDAIALALDEHCRRG